MLDDLKFKTTQDGIHRFIDEAGSVSDIRRFREMLRGEIQYSLEREKKIRYGDIPGQVKIYELS